jgi:tetratricopeptide (TPR) repeat protein
MAFGSRIYVSYCASDKDWTRAFVEALRWSGGNVWQAEQGHPAGAAPGPDPDAERELTTRTVFVAVMSPAGLLAPGVERDVRLAARQRELDRERVTLVVLASECRVPRAWYGCEIVSGVSGTGMPPQEAARRVREVLAAIPQRTVRTRVVAPDSTGEALDRARALQTQGRAEEALAAYDQALDLVPALAVAWNGKGEVLLQSERYEEAVAAFDQAVQFDGTLATAWHGYGLALAQMEQPRDALEAQEHAVALDPDLAPAWSALGAALTKVGKHGEALEAYEKSLALDPRQPQTWRRKGDTLQQLARSAGSARSGRSRQTRGSGEPAPAFDDALEAYDQALALAPQYLRAWNNKIHLLDALGRTADAAKARCERERAMLGRATRDS